MKRLITSLLIAAPVAVGLTAQEPADTTVTTVTTTITDHINASGKATVTHPAKLNARLVADAGSKTKADDDSASPTRAVGGYRIQLFSGNNAHTAKNEAARRAAAVDAQFPEYATYVNYDAPYWRLKVGDFRNYEEASAALSRLKAAMPAYAREMRVVRGRITPRD